MRDTDIQKRDYAQTLARGLLCLEALSSSETTMSCSEVASSIDISRAAARRLLLTLMSLGYVREERGFYTTTPKVLALGRGMARSVSLWNLASREVVALANRLDEPCSISVLDGLSILFVCRDATRRIFTSRLGVGDRLPAHCSASGKILLASLPEKELALRLSGANLEKRGPNSITDIAHLVSSLTSIREKDYAVAIDEMEEGTLSIAVPLRERAGKVVAALSAATHKSRMTPGDLKKTVLPQLKIAARGIENIISDFQDRNLASF